MDDDGHIMIDEDDQPVTAGSQIGLVFLIISKINLSKKFNLIKKKLFSLFFKSYFIF